MTTRTHWFPRDHTRRHLTDIEAAFLASLSERLTTIDPAQVKSEDTAVTAEGDSCLICLIPHRCLGGLSIVATLSGSRVDVSWAQVTSLRYHDELDAAYWVRHRDSIPQVGASVQQAADIVSDQLERPILMRARIAGDGQVRRVECLLRDDQGRLHRIATFGRGSSWVRRWFQPETVRAVEVSFTDASPPPWIEPVDSSTWFAGYTSSG